MRTNTGRRIRHHMRHGIRHYLRHVNRHRTSRRLRHHMIRGIRQRMSCRIRYRIAGVSLVEMLVCLLLSMLIALMAIGLLVSSRAAFSAQDDATRLVENGLYALATIERAIRQAGYENWSAVDAPLITTPDMAPAVLGLDDTRLPATPAALASAVAPGVNGSDVLALRFFGSGESSGAGDGSVLNCAGVAVAEPAGGNLDHGRGWSIFHIATDSAGYPELRCKYRSRDGLGWESESVAQEIDAMQVLYGVDVSGDGLADRFVNATALQDALALATPAVTAGSESKAVAALAGAPAGLPASAPNGGPVSASGIAASSAAISASGSVSGSGPASASSTASSSAANGAPTNVSNPWNDVVSVRIALLVRGVAPAAGSPTNREFDFFGAAYSTHRGSSDRGVRIREDQLGAGAAGRARRLFSLTVPLRNRAGRNPAATPS